MSFCRCLARSNGGRGVGTMLSAQPSQSNPSLIQSISNLYLYLPFAKANGSPASVVISSRECQHCLALSVPHAISHPPSSVILLQRPNRLHLPTTYHSLFYPCVHPLRLRTLEFCTASSMLLSSSPYRSVLSSFDYR